MVNVVSPASQAWAPQALMQEARSESAPMMINKQAFSPFSGMVGGRVCACVGSWWRWGGSVGSGGEL